MFHIGSRRHLQIWRCCCFNWQTTVDQVLKIPELREWLIFQNQKIEAVLALISFLFNSLPLNDLFWSLSYSILYPWISTLISIWFNPLPLNIYYDMLSDSILYPWISTLILFLIQFFILECIFYDPSFLYINRWINQDWIMAEFWTYIYTHTYRYDNKRVLQNFMDLPISQE